MEVFTNQTGTTTEIDDVNVLRQQLVALGESGDEVRDVFWIWVPHSEVHALVIRGYMVEMDLSFTLFIFIAFFIHLDVLLRQFRHRPIKLVRLFCIFFANAQIRRIDRTGAQDSAVIFH